MPRPVTPVGRRARPCGPCPLLTRRCCLPLWRVRRPHEEGYFEAYTAACTLAVYASWPRLPVYCLTATQDSLPAGGQPCRTGLSPAGSLREVSASV